MAIRLSGLGGSGGLPKLAPDLTFPTDINSSLGYKSLTLTLTPATYNTLLSLTGKFEVRLLQVESLVNETVDVRLTIDGVVVWDSAVVSGASIFRLLGAANSTTDSNRQSITCNSSLLLELRTVTDTNVNLRYDARPIL